MIIDDKVLDDLSAQVGFRFYSHTVVTEITGLEDERHDVIGFA